MFPGQTTGKTRGGGGAPEKVSGWSGHYSHIPATHLKNRSLKERDQEITLSVHTGFRILAVSGGSALLKPELPEGQGLDLDNEGLSGCSEMTRYLLEDGPE